MSIFTIFNHDKNNMIYMMNKRYFLHTVLALVICVFTLKQGNACTNILVTKGASKDGSTMLTYSADSYQLYGELYHYPAASYANGSMLKV